MLPCEFLELIQNANSKFSSPSSGILSRDNRHLRYEEHAKGHILHPCTEVGFGYSYEVCVLIELYIHSTSYKIDYFFLASRLTCMLRDYDRFENCGLLRKTPESSVRIKLFLKCRSVVNPVRS